MSEYIAWADTAAAADLVAPDTAKQHLGWTYGEQPPHEYFNWMQNRTDTRLARLEAPSAMTTATSEAYARQAVIEADTLYQVPEYVVGAGHLQVFLDGLECVLGETYLEVGASGNTSTHITFEDNIPTSFRITAKAPVAALDNYGVPPMNASDLESLIGQIVDTKLAE